MNDMQPLPIDSAPCWCPSWDEIKDKAHCYTTARIRMTGEYVRISHVVFWNDWQALAEPMFAVRPQGWSTTTNFPTEELCDFCL